MVDADQFRLAMGRFATGVTVLTTFSGGHDHAMTANALTSVSMDPLLVLVCVEVDARFHDAITESGVWGVSVLGVDQRPVAQWLSTQGRPLHGQLELDRAPPGGPPPEWRCSTTPWRRWSCAPPRSTVP